MKHVSVRNAVGSLLVFCAVLLATPPVWSQTYPQRPLRIVVPYAPGGPTDMIARIVGQKLSEDVGQPVIVQNRPGAGGLIGADLVAKSTPDGYTFLLCSSGPMAVSPALGRKMPYDPVRDLAPVTLVVTIPYLLLANANGPASVKELIARARKDPAKLNYGSAGAATTSYFAAALFAMMAKIDIVHVPYKGSSQAAAALAGGHLDLMFEAAPAALAAAKTGKVRVLGISTLERFSLLPDVPTIQESGVPGYQANTWSGICTAAGTPRVVIEQVSQLIVKRLREPEMRQRFDSLGAIVVGNTPQQFAAFVRDEQVRWSRLVQETGAKAQPK